MKIKVVADDKIPFLQGVLEPYCQVEYLPGAAIAAADLHDANALLTRTRTICNAGLLDRSKVKFIATATIGFDHIDRDYCESRNIFWTSAPGCNSGSVMQYIVSALLNLAAKHRITLAGKTLGVVGIGNVGGKVVKAATALGMNVMQCDPPRARTEGPDGFCSLREIQQQADFITFHVPLNRDGIDRTWHLADREFMAEMRPGSFLINSSRGEVVDPAALKQSLSAGHLAGAVLDVWENEPEIDRELLAMVDFATPHIAGYSADGKANGTSMSVNALSRFFGLGLDTWQVPEIPAPPQTDLIINQGKMTTQEKVRIIVNRSYNIAVDDNLLKTAPDDFEKQRGNYYLRREFPAFRLSGDPAAATILTGLGFLLTPPRPKDNTFTWKGEKS